MRYADHGRINLGAERAGQRVMVSISASTSSDAIRLKVNRHKSAVELAKKRPVLGFPFFGRGREVKVRIAPGARRRAKDRLRQLTSRKWSVSMQQRIEEINRYTVGWTNYYALADTPSVFEGLDDWLRQVRCKECKRPKTKPRGLAAPGIHAREATEWSYSGNGLLARLRLPGSSPAPCPTLTGPAQHGLKGSTAPHSRFWDGKRTAGCGSARPVVWEALG